VEDTWGKKKYLVEQAPDGTGNRVDYAVVRLVRVNCQPGYLVFLLLSGATSLGTLGAVEWVISPDSPQFPFDKFLSCLMDKVKDNVDDADIELLLRVEATAYKPKRQWI